jgi:hypothetical protein
MLSRLMRRFTAAVAAIGAVLFIGGNRAEAALEYIISDPSVSVTELFYNSNSNIGSVTLTTAIDNYTGQVNTTLTNFNGNPAVGSMSTTLNLVTTGTATSALTVTVMVINNIAALDAMTTSPNIAIPVTALQLSGSVLSTWIAPSGTGLVATANTSTSSQAVALTGTAATTTYFNAPPVLTSPAVPGTAVVTSGTLSLTALNSNVLMTAPVTGTGTYNLSQSITVSGITSVGNSPVNVTGTSTVANLPEPSSMALAGLGALGFIGYGLRRRKASGT